MASIKYYPQKKTGKCKVYIRLSLGRGQDFRLSTGLTISDASKWLNGMPDTLHKGNKKLYSKLNDFSLHIDKALLEAEKDVNINTKELTSVWLKNHINTYFNSKKIDNTANLYLVPFALRFANNLKTYKKKGIKYEHKESTKKKYKSFVNILEGFDDYRGVKTHIKNVGKEYCDDLEDYLKKERGKALNTVGRNLKMLKTILKDAEAKGLKVDATYKDIKGFQGETIVTKLSFEEIDDIYYTDMKTDNLQIAKEWIIIGVYTGQRISDLYRMNKKMLVKNSGEDFISLTQYKTKKKVLIPVHHRVREILDKYNNDFPPNLYKNEESNRAKLSKLSKEVCRLSGLISIERGRLNGVVGMYPKYKLIQNHTFRRSFCSNYYNKEGWSVPMIKAISGHLSDSSFLLYIDADDTKPNFMAAKMFKDEKNKASANHKNSMKVVE